MFEDLTNIRENVPQASWHHLWAFRRLYEYVEYKAREQGVEAVGYENHADYNAAKNIGLQYLRRRQNADDGGTPVDVRLNRGTLTVSGEYNLPAADAA